MFSYADLVKEIGIFNTYGVEVGSIGESVLGERIPYIFVGKKNADAILVQGAIHAREHITALLVLCQAKFLVKHSDYLMKGGIYFVPMVNVDGVKIAQEGVDFIDNKKLRKQLIEINGSKDFSLWKANANAVDLNTNFDAKWGQGETNLFFRSPSNYVGKCPCSEPESRALASFTERISPLATLSYHCKGEVIYWKFSQSKTRMARDARLAKGVSALTGYPLGNSDGSTGGYKDWCIDKLNISALTIEVGDDKFDHPFPYSEFESILNKNEDVPRKLLNTVVREKEKTMTAEEIVDLPRVLN